MQRTWFITFERASVHVGAGGQERRRMRRVRVEPASIEERRVAIDVFVTNVGAVYNQQLTACGNFGPNRPAEQSSACRVEGVWVCIIVKENFGFGVISSLNRL